MRKATQHLLIVVCLVFLVQPYLIGSVWTAGSHTLYLNTEIDLATEETWTYGYYNTTGDYLSGNLVETLESNGTVSAPFVASAQDLDGHAYIVINIAPTTVFNLTAWLSDTTDGISHFAFRIGASENGVPVRCNIGFGASSYREVLLAKQTVYTSDTQMKYVYVSAATKALLEDASAILSGSYLVVDLEEVNANEFINGNTIYFEIHFYTDALPTQLTEYLVAMGILDLILAFGMSRMWNPTWQRRRGYGRRYRRWRSRRRYHRRYPRSYPRRGYRSNRRFRRPRFRRRRYYR